MDIKNYQSLKIYLSHIIGNIGHNMVINIAKKGI
jgi:hypothetical protein